MMEGGMRVLRGPVVFIYLKSFMGTVPQKWYKRAQRFACGIGCPAEG
jgi:hypothetical protein